MAEEESKQNYKQSLKNTSLLGGVQVLTIIITIIRSKFVAILLGPVGMGIHGLLTSTTSTITAFTNFGLSTSAVKDIAQANATNDTLKISRVISIFRKLVWITGMLGLVACLLLAPYLSRITFGNSDYTFAFILLSITLLFTQLNAGQITLLQGMRKFTWMAKASLFGSFIGLFISIPLYYIFGMQAIVLVIILASGTSLLLSWLYSKKIKIEKVRIPVASAVKEGKEMVRMGFFLGLQGALAVLSAYFVRIFVSRTGGVAEVGLYVAGFMIVNTYVGLIFNAMGTEYYPRLATFANSREQFNQAINQQMEISVLLLSPIIIIFITFVDLGIILLYSKEFLAIDSMLYFAALGMLFRAPAWCISYSFLAKGDSNAFFINEVCTITYTTILNVLFYKYLGLLGMGISFMVIYFIYWIQVYWLAYKRHLFRVDTTFWKVYLPQLIISIISVILILTVSGSVRYLLGILLIACSVLFTYKKLNAEIAIKEIFKNRFRR